MLFSSYGDVGQAVTAVQAQVRARLLREVTRIQGVINGQKAQLASTKSNPLNYVLETQRDAMTRAQNTITQNEHVLQQLKDTLEPAVTGGSTGLQRWIDLAAIIGSVGDLQIWKNNLGNTSTANMISTVAKDTAQDIADGAKTGLKIAGLSVVTIFAVAAGGLFLLKGFKDQLRR